ncbi:MAG: hypothetical protein MZV49_25465 [Rhodopseudomonas palustris]|nr:hypothetical protein [Rhodopseudomonas palustris]
MRWKIITSLGAILTISKPTLKEVGSIWSGVAPLTACNKYHCRFVSHLRGKVYVQAEILPRWDLLWTIQLESAGADV